jgi:acid phosphatase
MLIVEENQEYGSIIGNSNAPYIDSLATAYMSATNWYAVQHASQNDYVELLAGSNLGLPQGTPYSATTLVDELHNAGMSWRAYMESMPVTPCFHGTLPSDGLYAPVHNPYHYFTRYTASSGGWCSSANLTTEGVVTYPGSSGLIAALSGANPPGFVQISPNNCDNMHGDSAPPSPCRGSTNSQLIKAGDAWLSSNIGPVIQSAWFQQGGIIILTWDEGTSNLGCCTGVAAGGNIATIVITSRNKGLGKYTGAGDHYGTLAAIERAYGIGLLLNSGQSVNGDLTGAFG